MSISSTPARPGDGFGPADAAYPGAVGRLAAPATNLIEAKPRRTRKLRRLVLTWLTSDAAIVMAMLAVAAGMVALSLWVYHIHGANPVYQAVVLGLAVVAGPISGSAYDAAPWVWALGGFVGIPICDFVAGFTSGGRYKLSLADFLVIFAGTLVAVVASLVGRRIS